VDLLADHRLGSAHVHTGFIDPADPTRTVTQPMPDFTLQFWDGAAWLPVPSATITGNTEAARVVDFSSPVTTSRVRLVVTSAFNGRLHELLLFPPREGGWPIGREVINATRPAAKWDDFSDSSWGLLNQAANLRLALASDAASAVLGPASADALPAGGWQLLLNYRDGSYRIRHVATGQCLALASLSLDPGTSVVAEDYSGLPHQDWILQTVGSNRFRLVNLFSGLALQPVEASVAVGASLVVQPVASGLAAQHWSASLLRHHPKKGVAGTANLIRTSANAYVTDSDLTFIEDFYRRLGGAWSYTWGRQASDAFSFMDRSHTFNPMQWGNFNWTHGTNLGPPDRLHRDLQSNPKPVHLLGFNEPDKSDQANLPVATAIARWPRLEAQNVPLVAPAPASAFGGWLSDFVAQADALGYRRDYTAVHWYAAPSADSLIAHLQQAHNTFGRPIWLTEFSAVRWSGSATWSDADNFNFLAEFLWRAESLPWLKRYSLFAFIQSSSSTNQSAPDPAEAPRSNALRSDGSLTPFGQLYAGWDGITDVLPNRAYHLHSHGSYQRAQNPASGNLPAFVSPDSSELGQQWFLIPGATAGTWRILSTRDGRPLRFVDGFNVTLGSVGQIGPSVEWRLAADQHGRYFIEHPSSNKRLKNNGDGTFGMDAITNTGDPIKWRFVRPAESDPAGPPAAPTDLAAVPSESAIALSWSAVADATSYSVERSVTGAGPWTAVASGLPLPQWTDTGLAPASTFHYRVTATNLYALDSAPSEAVSATTPAAASYAAWAESIPWNGADSSPTADPDGDGWPNLLEYAFGSDPLLADGPSLRWSLSSEASPHALSLTFTRLRSDLTYAVEASSNLADWVTVAVNPGAIGEEVTVTDEAPTGATRRFLRLRVTGR
jgi:hypothetical protein